MFHYTSRPAYYYLIGNYVERTKIKISLKFKQVLKCNETLRNYIRHKKLHFFLKFIISTKFAHFIRRMTLSFVSPLFQHWAAKIISTDLKRN